MQSTLSKKAISKMSSIHKFKTNSNFKTVESEFEGKSCRGES